MNDAPWTFGEAREHCRKASQRQADAEEALRSAYIDLAEKRKAYHQAHAGEIVRCHGDGIAWSTAPDLARGDDRVAQLRYERDVAEGVVAAMEHAAWRANNDRKDAQRFADWSQRRELAETGHQPLEEAA